MSREPRHFSKTDLRRGRFTKPETGIASQPLTGEIATSPDEQALLFDLTTFDAGRTLEQVESELGLTNEGR